MKSVFSSQRVKGAIWEQRSVLKVELLILPSVLVNLNRSHNKPTTINLELAETQISSSSQVAHTTTIYSHGFIMLNCVIHKLALICGMRHCQRSKVTIKIPHSLAVSLPSCYFSNKFLGIIHLISNFGQTIPA